jgi:hypothetical protein
MEYEYGREGSVFRPACQLVAETTMLILFPENACNASVRSVEHFRA